MVTFIDRNQGGIRQLCLPFSLSACCYCIRNATHESVRKLFRMKWESEWKGVVGLGLRGWCWGRGRMCVRIRWFMDTLALNIGVRVAPHAYRMAFNMNEEFCDCSCPSPSKCHNNNHTNTNTGDA